MRILLVDTTQHYPSSPTLLEALTELASEYGFEFDFLDQGIFLKPLERSLVHKIAYRILGRRPLTYWTFNDALLKNARTFRPNVLLVVKGAYISPTTLERIKSETNAILINYATDDPFNSKVNTKNLIKGIPLYDVYACTKRAIMKDVQDSGCKRVIYVPFGYKPTVYFPERPSTPEEATNFSSDVVSLGGCDADRIPYFEALLQALPDVRLHLYGGYWDRHSSFSSYYRGFARGRDYRLALSGTKIAVNLVRRANRDGHGMRTFEIPACRAFMLAERTDEHLALMREDEEAAFFKSPEELVEKVRSYLLNDDARKRIALAGYHWVTTCGNTYKNRLIEILKEVEWSARVKL